jgi:lipoprotein-anchoring transpeptidase ErfK/SrfK
MRRAVAVIAALALAGCGDDAARQQTPGAVREAGALADRPPVTMPRTATGAEPGAQPEAQPAARPEAQPAARPEAQPAARPAAVPVRRQGAVIERRTQLRRSPGGAVVTTLGRRTSFRSRQVLAVVARRGDWLGVLHPSLGHGRRTGWIPAGAARVLARRYEIVVDRSALRGTLYRDGRVVQHFRVGVGRRGNATPLGRYAITDRLIAGAGSPYGCCILALTGRQPALPQGWTGGDRLALHGGPAWRVGIRTTSGCVTVGARPLTRMFRRVTAGTRVTVKA